MGRSLSTRRRWLAVFCGGFLGAIARYLLSTTIQSWLGKGFPYDILIINLTGALILALITTLAEATFLIGPTRRLFINVGFLGAYTTFSTFALGDILLFSKGQWLLALIYVVVSILGGVLVVMLGDILGQTWVSLARRKKPAPQALPASSSRKAGNEDHIDIQDDLLLPEIMNEGEIRHRVSDLPEETRRSGSGG
jgi:protein CrcB